MAAIEASMLFLKDGSWPSNEKPYSILYPTANGAPSSNYQDIVVDNVPVRDMRPIIDQLSLDRQGFVVGKLKTKLRYEDFKVEERLRTIYAEEVRQYLLDLLGARAAYIHECVIRQRRVDSPNENQGYGQPVAFVHTDYTVEYIKKLIGQLARGKSGLITDSKFQMINVWKPLRGPLRDWPLALCDLQSVQKGDLHSVDEVHQYDILESHMVTYQHGQRWYYLSDQDPSEILIFKSVDSDTTGEVPHAAFVDPRYPNAERRESIECRVLVVY